MRSKTVALREEIGSNELIKKELEKKLATSPYEVSMPINQWSINPKGKKCVLVKKSLWNSVCVEINEKKKEVEIFSVLSNPHIDTIFRKKFGVLGMLLLESSWKKSRNAIYETLQ
jgi:hypothetical protein